jgi:hypothetical protein
LNSKSEILEDRVSVTLLPLALQDASHAASKRSFELFSFQLTIVAGFG